jgi:transcription-repair coupling factor (superfamily II helicase)
LPDDYVADEPTRLNFYQRLASVTAEAQLAALMDELADRFGPPPEAAQNLAYVVSLRLAAERASVRQVQSVDGEVVVKFERLPSLNVAALSKTVGASLRTGSNQIRLPKADGRRWMERLQVLVNELPGTS